MKKLLFAICFIASTGLLFAQSNIKIKEYKVLQFDKDETYEYKVPEGETWKIESIVFRKNTKIEFVIDEKMYLVILHEQLGPTVGFLPFYCPEKKKLSFKTYEDVAISIAVLNIE